MTRHTPMEDSLANSLYVSFPDVLGQDILSLPPGLAATTGSACHPGDENPSAAFLVMRVSHDVAMGAVQLSPGHGNTEVGITAAADKLVFALGETPGQ
jgi:cysteine desulfurase